MYRKILVPLDGSAGAEVTLPFVKELAARISGVEVVLLHIVGPEDRGKFEPLHRAYLSATIASVRSQARKVQQKVGVKPSAEPVKVNGEMVVGYPDDEIPRFTAARGVDLILMSTQDSSGGRRALGHVADKILRQSKIPVWLVRAGVRDPVPYDKWVKKTLLVVLDGSETAESVLPHVETLSRQTGETVEVILVRVCEPPPMPSFYSMELSGVPLNWGQYVRQELNQCKQISKAYLKGVEKQLKEKKFAVRSEVLLGRASTEIINFAANIPQSVIMMTTHGRSGLGKLVYGSVAESVLLGAANPIFLVRITK